MDVQEIKAMIEYYGMSRQGDKIRMSKNLDDANNNIETIKAAKPEIMAYWQAETERRVMEEKQKDETFYSIPGVRELAEAREEWGKWRREFSAAMERGDSIFSPAPQSDIQSLEKNEMAVWALKVKREALYSENDEICSIGKRAYDALRNGASPEETKAAYDAEKDAFIERHMWD